MFPRIVARMAEFDPDFVLGTGDYIYGAADQATLQAQWYEFFIALKPLQAREQTYFVPATGNHDIRGGVGRRLFVEYFQRTYFSFDMGGSHFIVLDTEEPGKESRIADEQRIWLKKDLASAQNAWHIFVALHRPFWPTGPHKGDSLDKYPEERDGLHGIFAQHKVSCVFQGHEHIYHRTTRDGVEYIITGGAGAPLYASPENGGFHHFLSVKADRLRYNIDIVRVK